ncbi:MAG: hypothetical protein ACRDYX_07770 [Egibacteraceae bacterium]
MQVMFERCAALDVHKKTVTACARTPGEDGQRESQTKTFRTFVTDLEELRDWLKAQGATVVAMEATGV